MHVIATTKNILMILLMFMVFTGKTASAIDISCHMEMDPSPPQHSKTNPCMESMNQDVKMHHDSKNCCSQSKVNKPQYCDNEGNCTSSDFSPALLFNAPILGRDFDLQQKNSKSPFLVTKQFPTTLYRPPISL